MGVPPRAVLDSAAGDGLGICPKTTDIHGLFERGVLLRAPPFGGNDRAGSDRSDRSLAIDNGASVRPMPFARLQGFNIVSCKSTGMDQRDLASLGVLGVLAEEDGATIDRIHEKLKHNFGRYWGASTGILAPTLSALENDGLVELTRVEQSWGYTLTAAGRERLRALLKQPVQDVSHELFHPHLLMKVGFAHHLPTADRRAEIAELQAQLREERDQIRTVQLEHDDAATEHTGYRGDLFELQIRIIDTCSDWLAELTDDQQD